MFPGGELLPGAPLQPCAGAPSGRGHLFSGWVNLAPCNFSSNNVLLAVQAWGTPSAWRHVPRPPIRWVSSGRWVLSEPCQYIPCPLLPTISSRVFSARHNIKQWKKGEGQGRGDSLQGVPTLRRNANASKR